MPFHLITGPEDLCNAPDCKWCDVMKKRFDYIEIQKGDSSKAPTFHLDVNAPEFVPGDTHCVNKSEDGPVLIYSTTKSASNVAENEADSKGPSGQPPDPTKSSPVTQSTRQPNDPHEYLYTKEAEDLYTKEAEAAARLKGCELASLAFADTLRDMTPMMLEEAQRIILRANKRKLQDHERKILLMCQQSEEELIRLVRSTIPPLGDYYQREREVTLARLNRITSLIEMQKAQVIAIGADPEKREEQRLLYSAMEQTGAMLDQLEAQLQWLGHRTRELALLVAELREEGHLEFRAV